MNVTIWNTAEETVSSFFLGGATVFVHCYAIFLCSAIYDYQDEKPCEEKGPDDIQLKDLMTAQSYFLYYTGSFIGFLVKNILWQFSSVLKFKLLVREKLFLPDFRAFLGNQKLRWCC